MYNNRCHNNQWNISLTFTVIMVEKPKIHLDVVSVFKDSVKAQFSQTADSFPVHWPLSEE